MSSQERPQQTFQQLLTEAQAAWDEETSLKAKLYDIAKAYTKAYPEPGWYGYFSKHTHYNIANTLRSACRPNARHEKSENEALDAFVKCIKAMDKKGQLFDALINAVSNHQHQTDKGETVSYYDVAIKIHDNHDGYTPQTVAQTFSVYHDVQEEDFAKVLRKIGKSYLETYPQYEGCWACLSWFHNNHNYARALKLQRYQDSPLEHAKSLLKTLKKGALYRAVSQAVAAHELYYPAEKQVQEHLDASS